MEIYVMAKSYDSYGAHRTLSPIAGFLLQEAPQFGDAVKEVTVTLHFRSAGKPKRTLEDLLELHERHRSTLPKITYRRTKRKFQIDVASELISSDEWKPSPRLSPWEKLDIDWEDFHPASREILDDPFFWDRTDELSPHGNDTGADLLEAYRDWRKSYPDGVPNGFLESLVAQWGYTGIEELDPQVRDEAAIALAFADLKLRATCDPAARELALISIESQRKQT